MVVGGRISQGMDRWTFAPGRFQKRQCPAWEGVLAMCPGIKRNDPLSAALAEESWNHGATATVPGVVDDRPEHPIAEVRKEGRVCKPEREEDRNL